MGQFSKSISDRERITSGLIDLKEEVRLQKEATKVNNKQLMKLNQVAQLVQQEKIIKLEQEIRDMKEDQKWVDTDANPGIDLNPAHLMKKLNVI